MVAKYEARLWAGEYFFLIVMTVCTSFSIRTAKDRPKLRSRAFPWGVERVPPHWRAYLNHHNRLVSATIRLIRAAAWAGVDWLLENPAPRWDNLSPAYWQEFDDYGTLFDILIAERIAPPHHLPRDVQSAVGRVGEAVYAICRFGSRHQKYTCLWGTEGAEPILVIFRDMPCECAPNSHIKIEGRDRGGSISGCKVCCLRAGGGCRFCRRAAGDFRIIGSLADAHRFGLRWDYLSADRWLATVGAGSPRGPGD